jgi:hypothetical protein
MDVDGQLGWGLVVFLKPEASIHLLVQPSVVVGRAVESDIVVSDGAVSRQHCVLSRADVFGGSDIRATLHNLSKNGTVVEGSSGGFAAVPQDGSVVLQTGSAVELTENCTFVFAPLSRLEDAARRQVERYFSKENVRRDAHLQRLMDTHGGAVPLSLLMSRLQPITALELSRAMHTCAKVDRITLDSGDTGVRLRRSRPAPEGSLEALSERACDAIGTIIDAIRTESDGDGGLHAIAEANAGWVPLVDVMSHAAAAPALEAWMHAALRAAQGLARLDGASVPLPSPRSRARAAAGAKPASDSAVAPPDALCPFDLRELDGSTYAARISSAGTFDAPAEAAPGRATTAPPRYVRDLGLALAHYLGGSYDAQRDAQLLSVRAEHNGWLPLAFVATLPRVQLCLEAQIAAQISAPSASARRPIEVGKGQEGGGFALRKKQRRYSSRWDRVGSGNAKSVLDTLGGSGAGGVEESPRAIAPGSSLASCATPRSTAQENLSLVQHAARAQVLALLRKHRLRQERLAARDGVTAEVEAEPTKASAAGATVEEASGEASCGADADAVPPAAAPPLPPKSPRVAALGGKAEGAATAELSPSSPPWTPTASPSKSGSFDDTPLRPPNPLRIVSPGASPAAARGATGVPLILPVAEDRDAILNDRDALILEALIDGNDGWAPLRELMHFPCMQPVGEAEIARALVPSEVVAIKPLADGTFAVYPRAASVSLSPKSHGRGQMLPSNWAPTGGAMAAGWGLGALYGGGSAMLSPPAATPTVGARMNVRASGGIRAVGSSERGALDREGAGAFAGAGALPADGVSAAAPGRAGAPSSESEKLMSVMTYNVLAEKYAHSFSYTAPSALQWAYRSEALKAEILSTRPHLLCLQEVQCGPTEYSDHSRWFQAWLRLEGGYNCAFCPKMDAGGYQLDGIQIGNLIAWHAADFDVVGDVLHVSLDREILERGLLPFDEVQYMGQVAIFAALRERSTGGIFILSTTCVCSPSSNAAALS